MPHNNNNTFKKPLSYILIFSALSGATPNNLSAAETITDKIQSPDADSSQKLVIWGESKEHKKTDRASPKSILTPEDMVSMNSTTTEDLVKYEPGLVIRKRFIGDSNGTIGIRGSNMFQTTRSMVFSDGVPLHYFLQTRWSGAPRWSLVSADEIAQIEIIYGPFSAEYGGNAMGGVVNIETSIPTERRVHLDAGFFSHDYQESGFDDRLNGNKQFLSYEDKIDDFSFYFSYNHLQNDGHPQTFRFSGISDDTPDGSEIAVTGGLEGVDEYGNDVIYFGNDGISKAETDNYKIKLGYELEDWFALFNVAYEDRTSDTTFANSYLTDTNDQAVWDGTLVQNGSIFSVRERNFAGNTLDRQSLLLGLRLQGELGDDWLMETSLSSFKVLQDETRTALANELSPAHTLDGTIRDYDNTGWQTAKVSFQNDRFMQNENLSFVTGINYENYELAINNYNSDNYQSGVKTGLSGTSGGDTSLKAVYAQFDWDINSQWNSIIGGRYESWNSDNGFFDDQLHDDRSESRFSPKLAVSYAYNPSWTLRYSVAKAFRFPIVEELFQNERRTQGTSLANANLEPEDGFHQNLMLQKNIEDGYLRINYFSEQIDDAIFAQTTVIDNRAINTFIPIDRVDTTGIEFIYNQIGLFNNALDVRFNTTYLDSKIEKNTANLALEGKDFPRMPNWRANLSLNYHLNDSWDIGGGTRYANNSFGDLDNADTASNVFGAHDSYFFVDLKTNYKINNNTKLSLGIDNVTDEAAFVHHPWPLRTVYVEISLDL
jgi:iron complex outermembrane receptor protein